MKFAIKGSLLAALLALAVPATAGADTVISTLDNTPTSATPTGTDNDDTIAAGQAFLMGGTSLGFESVTLDLLGGTGTSTVNLMTDSGVGTPGSVLETWSVTPPGSSLSNITLNTTSSIELNANTQYWVQVIYAQPSSNSTPGPWAYTNPAPPYGSGFTVEGTEAYISTIWNEFDGGSTFTYTPYGPFGGPYMFSIASVPEPSTLVSASIAVLFGIGVTIHKRRKRKADATI